MARPRSSRLEPAKFPPSMRTLSLGAVKNHNHKDSNFIEVTSTCKSCRSHFPRSGSTSASAIFDISSTVRSLNDSFTALPPSSRHHREFLPPPSILIMAQQPTHITFWLKPFPGQIHGQLQESSPGQWRVESSATVAHVAKMLEVLNGLQPKGDPSPASLAHRRTYPFTIYKGMKKGVFCPLSASKTLADVFKAESQEADLGKKTLFFTYKLERYNK